MTRDELNYTIQSNRYLQGGMKEARVKIREFIRGAESSGNKLQSKPTSCVDASEFLEAVKILLAYTFKKGDEIPEFWRCNTDCHILTTSIFCCGECNLDDDSKKLCPFFVDESNI